MPKMLRARVAIILDIDKEEFPMPVDGNPSEELEDALQEVLDEVYGTRMLVGWKKKGVEKRGKKL